MPLGMRVTACFNIFVMKSVRNFSVCWGSKGRGLKFGGGFRCRSTHPTLANVLICGGQTLFARLLLGLAY